MQDNIPHIIVMGVSGCGKSTLGKALALHTGRRFIEGDDFHNTSNINKMLNGIPLSDKDRKTWLENIHLTLQHATKHHEKLIVSCSALKQSYRDLLTGTNMPLCFLWCHAPYEVLYQRLCNRHKHFMPSSLLRNQYETLEHPLMDAHTHTHVHTLACYYKINVDQPIHDVLEECIMRVQKYPTPVQSCSYG